MMRHEAYAYLRPESTNFLLAEAGMSAKAEMFVRFSFIKNETNHKNATTANRPATFTNFSNNARENHKDVSADGMSK
jgi:hypothetical protein